MGTSIEIHNAIKPGATRIVLYWACVQDRASFAVHQEQPFVSRVISIMQPETLWLEQFSLQRPGDKPMKSTSRPIPWPPGSPWKLPPQFAYVSALQNEVGKKMKEPCLQREEPSQHQSQSETGRFLLAECHSLFWYLPIPWISSEIQSNLAFWTLAPLKSRQLLSQINILFLNRYWKARSTQTVVCRSSVSIVVVSVCNISFTIEHREQEQYRFQLSGRLRRASFWAFGDRIRSPRFLPAGFHENLCDSHILHFLFQKGSLSPQPSNRIIFVTERELNLSHLTRLQLVAFDWNAQTLYLNSTFNRVPKNTGTQISPLSHEHFEQEKTSIWSCSQMRCNEQ